MDLKYATLYANKIFSKNPDNQTIVDYKFSYSVFSWPHESFHVVRMQPTDLLWTFFPVVAVLVKKSFFYYLLGLKPTPIAL